jgi:pimeloyl-ACP methyl ester carboxylesterase
LNALGAVQPDQGGDEDIVFAANMMDARVARSDAVQDGAPEDPSDATDQLGGVAYENEDDATGIAPVEQDRCIVVWGESIGAVAASRLALNLGKRCSGLFLDSGFVSGFDVYFDQWATSRAWIDERVAVFALWRKKGSPVPTRSLGYVTGADADARAAAPPIAFEAEAAPMHVGRSNSCCVDACVCAPVREFISNADTVPRLECPVVFLHAWGDRVVPATHSLALFGIRAKADKGDTGLVLFNANCHGVAGAAFRGGAKSAWEASGGVRKVVEFFDACCNK